MGIINKIIFALAVMLHPAIGTAVGHSGKEVSMIETSSGAPCTYFQLNGVGEADPVVANSPYFAVSQTHVGYKEIISILLVARTTGKVLTVVTTGGVACGHAAVSRINY